MTRLGSSQAIATSIVEGVLAVGGSPIGGAQRNNPFVHGVVRSYSPI